MLPCEDGFRVWLVVVMSSSVWALMSLNGSCIVSFGYYPQSLTLSLSHTRALFPFFVLFRIIRFFWEEMILSLVERERLTVRVLASFVYWIDVAADVNGRVNIMGVFVDVRSVRIGWTVLKIRIFFFFFLWMLMERRVEFKIEMMKWHESRILFLAKWYACDWNFIL